MQPKEEKGDQVDHRITLRPFGDPSSLDYYGLF